MLRLKTGFKYYLSLILLDLLRKFNKMKKICFLLFIGIKSLVLCGQIDSNVIGIMFYNTENFFDPADDSLTNDDSYTIEGMNRWNYKKMYHKRNQIAKVILSINGWEPPALIGFAEIENDLVLDALIRHPGLKKRGYQYIHFESPDSRGIDVALLYRNDLVEIITSYPISVIFPFEPQSKNREILYASVQLPSKDTLHLFVNHWTSRFGGSGATVLKREYYAQVLKNKVDSLLLINPESNIVIMGDFNDYPKDNSIFNILNAKERTDSSASLINLMLEYSVFANIGTHKNEEFWGCLDQFIISKSLIKHESNWIISEENRIYKPNFLVVPDEKNGGDKPFRTFLGFQYLGGFSDHLPIYLRIKMNRK